MIDKNIYPTGCFFTPTSVLPPSRGRKKRKKISPPLRQSSSLKREEKIKKISAYLDAPPQEI